MLPPLHVKDCLSVSCSYLDIWADGLFTVLPRLIFFLCHINGSCLIVVSDAVTLQHLIHQFPYSGSYCDYNDANIEDPTKDTSLLFLGLPCFYSLGYVNIEEEEQLQISLNNQGMALSYIHCSHSLYTIRKGWSCYAFFCRLSCGQTVNE